MNVRITIYDRTQKELAHYTDPNEVRSMLFASFPARAASHIFRCVALKIEAAQRERDPIVPFTTDELRRLAFQYEEGLPCT